MADFGHNIVLGFWEVDGTVPPNFSGGISPPRALTDGTKKAPWFFHNEENDRASGTIMRWLLVC